MKLPQSIILVSLPLLVATSSVTLGALLKPVFSVNDLTTSASYGHNPWEPSAELTYALGLADTDTYDHNSD